MKQNGLTLQEDITSFSTLIRRTTLMKSRLLSTAAAMFLLLGLIAGNAFAQLTDPSAVSFTIRKTSSDGWRGASADIDTVGRPFQLQVDFAVGVQTKDISRYVVTLPVGTATDSAMLENGNITLNYNTGGGGLVTDILTAGQIAIVDVNEPDAGVYSATKQPSLILTAPRDVSSAAITIKIVGGLTFGSTLAASNSHGLATADEQPNLYFGLVVTDTPTDTVAETSNFFLKNDKANGVVYNTAVAAILTGAVLSNSDSIGVVDRFGNYVPDFFGTADDSLLIHVAAAQGGFTLSGDGGVLMSKTADNRELWGPVGLVAGDTIIAITRKAGGQNTVTGATWAAALGNSVNDFDIINVTDGAANNANENNDLIHLPLWLGNSNATPAGNSALGITFTKDADMAIGDNVVFTFTVASTAGDTAIGTYLNVAASNRTTMTRVLQASGDSKLIGGLVLTDNGGGDYYVGEPITVGLTLTNIFGDVFSGATIGTAALDSILISFEYSDSMTVSTSKTTDLQGGVQVTSTKSTPAAIAISAAITGNAIHSGTTNGSGVTTVTFQYLGMSTHNVNDSLIVILAAKNNGKADTIKINIEPGAPVFFDTDTLVANLAAVTPIEGLAIDTILPIFALDTAYNRVSNLSLAQQTTYLDGVTLLSSASVVSAINFLIDGRDPVGYTSVDSISLTYTNIGAYGAASMNADPSFLGNVLHAAVSLDSSRINLGGLGDDALSLKLNYSGNNRRLSITFDPAEMGVGGFDQGVRTQDLTLISLQSPTLVDSLNTPTVTLTGTAGKTDTMTITVVLPVSIDSTANVLDQNSADSLYFLRLVNFGDAAGLPASGLGIGVSADNITYYAAGGIYQGMGDSVAFSTPITFNATSTAQTIYIKLYGIINPTVVGPDSTYRVELASSVTPIYSATAAITITPDTLAQYLLVSPSADQDTVRAGVTWLSQIDAGDAVDTLTVGDTAWFQIVVADQYGNMLTGSAGDDISASQLVLTSVDSTSTGNSLKIFQKYAGLNGTVGGGATSTDTVEIGDIVKDGGYYADSVGIIAASTNGGADYALVLNDTTGAAGSSSVTVYVKGGAASSITLAPDSLVTGNRGANLPTITATLKDAFGNAIVGGSVGLKLTVGDADGAFADTNGVDLAVGVDSVVISTDAAGQAMATWQAGGAGDSVNISVWATGVSAVTFRALTQFTDTEGVISIVSPSDSLVPNLATAGTIVVSVADADKVVLVYANVWRSVLTLNAQNTFDMSDAVAFDSVVSVVVASLDSTQVSLVLPATVVVDTAVVIKYQVVMVDAADSVTYGDTMMYVVAPKRGKRDMTDTAVNVADVMRLVYLIAIDEIVPKVVDYLGLDLDQDGTFDTPDILAELEIWKGTGTLLAGAGSLENATAKTSLSYKATDKATANLALNLESSHNMNVAVFRIKYDTEKFVFGEAKATDRLRNLSVVSGNNENDGVFTIVMINAGSGQILQGSGAVVNIQVSAVGEKFDGVGDISLLNASFDEAVSAELSREVLSPKALLPKAFALGQNYPNPFNPSTTIAYDIPEGDNVQVQLKVYNMRGQLVRTLVNDAKSEGSYQIQWDGSDNYGRRVSSGVFFYRIKAGEFSLTRKMVILK